MRFRRLLFLVAVALALGLGVRAWVLEPIFVASPSMEPTLPTGTHLFLDKVTFRLREPRRQDIIVLCSPERDGRDLIKRVIALPGETVELRAKKVLIDGRELEEPYARHKREGELLEGDDLGPLSVPAQSYFVLGDDRDESRDSSVWKDPATGEPIHFVRRQDVRGLVRGMY